LKRFDIWRANGSWKTRHVIDTAGCLAEFAEARKFRLAVQSESGHIVQHAIAIVVETIARLVYRKLLTETRRRVPLATFAQEVTFFANTNIDPLFIARITGQLVSLRASATRNLVDLSIAVGVDAVAQFNPGNNVRFAIPPESTHASLQTCSAIRYSNRFRRPAITFSLLSLFVALTTVVYGTIAIVIENVVAIFKFGKHFTRTIVPDAICAYLNSIRAAPYFSRKRRAAVTALHIRIFACACLVDEAITIVVQAIAAYLSQSGQDFGACLRHAIHTRGNGGLANTQPARDWRRYLGVASLGAIGIARAARGRIHADEQQDAQNQ
jgi:hypothetical protein